jgi:hypothetical protein
MATYNENLNEGNWWALPNRKKYLSTYVKIIAWIVSY